MLDYDMNSEDLKEWSASLKHHVINPTWHTISSSTRATTADAFILILDFREQQNLTQRKKKKEVGQSHTHRRSKERSYWRRRCRCRCRGLHPYTSRGSYRSSLTTWDRLHTEVWRVSVSDWLSEQKGKRRWLFQQKLNEGFIQVELRSENKCMVGIASSVCCGCSYMCFSPFSSDPCWWTSRIIYLTMESLDL